MNDLFFTFGICTFNSELFIAETLESIKYQIQEYGKGKKMSLIVSDDHSTDSTLEIVNNWISKNEDYFESTMVLTSSINKGIASSFCELLRNIKTEYFIKIDGDDLICSDNIFEKCIGISKNEMRIYFPFKFNSEKVYADEVDICNFIKYSGKQSNHKKDLRLFEMLKPFNTPEVVLGRMCFTDDCLKFVEEFTQFEDDTSLYYVLKHNTQMKMKFIIEPLVLYRVHNKSLSNGGVSVHQINFLDDLHNFKKHMLNNERSVFVKAYLFLCVWDTFLMKHRFSADNCIHRRIRKIWIDKNIKDAKSVSNYKATYQKIIDTCSKEQAYVEKINKNSKVYFDKEMGCQYGTIKEFFEES